MVVVMRGGVPLVSLVLLRARPSYCMASWPKVASRVALLPE